MSLSAIRTVGAIDTRASRIDGHIRIRSDDRRMKKRARGRQARGSGLGLRSGINRVDTIPFALVWYKAPWNSNLVSLLTAYSCRPIMSTVKIRHLSRAWNEPRLFQTYHSHLTLVIQRCYHGPTPAYEVEPLTSAYRTGKPRTSRRSPRCPRRYSRCG